jgi:hypothetical protein
MEANRPDEATLARARDVARFAQFLDAAIPIPGTPWRIGVESILGVIPGVGDVLGLALGAVVVHQASRAGAPPPLLRKMMRNVVLDALLGLVPVLGDVLDMAYKSNQINARLLLEHLGEVPVERAPRAPWALRAAVALTVAGLGWLAWRTWHAS